MRDGRRQGACGTAVAARRWASENEIDAARAFTPDHARSADRVLQEGRRSHAAARNLKLSVTERFEKLMALQRFAEEMRRAGLDPRHPRSGNNDGIPISAGRRQDYHFVSASTHSDKRPFNFTLTTDAGDLDILGEITGGGYSELLPYTITLRSFGIECRCLGLRRLIQVERASGRAKDWEAIAELEALAEESPPHPNTL